MTLGCKVNQYETVAIEGVLRERGHVHVALGEGCDVCILNTCAVTEESVKKSQKTVKRMKKLEPDALVAVCGCYTQLEKDIVEKLGADIISGTKDRLGFVTKIVKLLDEGAGATETTKKANALVDRHCGLDPQSHGQRADETGQGQEGQGEGQGDGSSVLSSEYGETVPLSYSNTSDSPDFFEELPPGSSESRTRALLKIQDGCDNFCTYCIVPYARGRSRSLSVEKITEYATKLAEQDYKEIIVAGIEISSYGKDLARQDRGTVPLSSDDKTEEPSPCVPARVPNVMTAIQAISRAAPNARLRLGSLDPGIMTEEFCQQLQKVPNLCSHFHLSIQSGCDDILKRMGRKYTAEQVLGSIKSIRNYFPNCGITADLIVGFPGETNEEFEQTLEFMRSTKLSEMHIFSYSKRPGTKAADMPNQINSTIKKDRAQKAKKLAKEMSDNFKEAQIGKTLEVLFEQEKDGFSTGHSSNYLEVRVAERIERNTMRNVKITDIKNESLYGKIVE